MTELTMPQYDDFKDRIGTAFGVTPIEAPSAGAGAGEPLAFLLIERSPLVSAGGYSSFSLLFRGPADGPQSQGTFVFTAPGFGPAALFAVPVSASADSIEFTVIFNQLEG